MLQISPFLWSLFHSLAGMNFVKCKSDLVTTLSPNSPILSNYTQNLQAIRPNMLQPLPAPSPSIPIILHFVLCTCQTSFLAFPPTYQTGSQWARSWLMIFTFTIPSACNKFLQYLLHPGFCFPQNSLPWLIYQNSPYLITFSPFTLLYFTNYQSLLHIIYLFISCLLHKI